MPPSVSTSRSPESPNATNPIRVRSTTPTCLKSSTISAIKAGSVASIVRLGKPWTVWAGLSPGLQRSKVRAYLRLTLLRSGGRSAGLRRSPFTAPAKRTRSSPRLTPLQFLPLLVGKNRAQPQRHLRERACQFSTRCRQVFDRFVGFALVNWALAQSNLQIAIGPLHRFPQIQQMAAILPHRAANVFPLSFGQIQVLDDRA